MASAAPDALTGKVAVIKMTSRSEIGWAIGAGRTGAIIGPYLGGVLIGLQWPTAVNFTLFAIPLVIGAFAAYAIKSPELIVVNDSTSK